MARSFTRVASMYLEVDSTPITTYPLTMACWFYTTVQQWQGMMWVGDKDKGNHFHSLGLNAAAWGTTVHARSRLANVKALSTVGYGLNAWHHAAGVFAANNDRRAFYDGGNKGVDANVSNDANYDRMSIGRQGDSSPDWYMGGYIAEAAWWNAALTDAEIASLALGYGPLLVRPQNLACYVPLIRDNDKDVVGGLSFTAFNAPTVAPHCRVRYPAMRLPVYVPAVAAALRLLERRPGRGVMRGVGRGV